MCRCARSARRWLARQETLWCPTKPRFYNSFNATLINLTPTGGTEGSVWWLLRPNPGWVDFQGVQGSGGTVCPWVGWDSCQRDESRHVRLQTFPTGHLFSSGSAQCPVFATQPGLTTSWRSSVLTATPGEIVWCAGKGPRLPKLNS